MRARIERATTNLHHSTLAKEIEWGIQDSPTNQSAGGAEVESRGDCNEIG